MEFDQQRLAVGRVRPRNIIFTVPERNVAFGAKNIGVEIGDPLPAVRRDVEIANGGVKCHGLRG